MWHFICCSPFYHSWNILAFKSKEKQIFKTLLHIKCKHNTESFTYSIIVCFNAHFISFHWYGKWWGLLQMRTLHSHLDLRDSILSGVWCLCIIWSFSMYSAPTWNWINHMFACWGSQWLLTSTPQNSCLEYQPFTLPKHTKIKVYSSIIRSEFTIKKKQIKFLGCKDRGLEEYDTLKIYRSQDGQRKRLNNQPNGWQNRDW